MCDCVSSLPKLWWSRHIPNMWANWLLCNILNPNLSATLEGGSTTSLILSLRPSLRMLRFIGVTSAHGATKKISKFSAPNRMETFVTCNLMGIQYINGIQWWVIMDDESNLYMGKAWCVSPFQPQEYSLCAEVGQTWFANLTPKPSKCCTLTRTNVQLKSRQLLISMNPPPQCQTCQEVWPY